MYQRALPILRTLVLTLLALAAPLLWNAQPAYGQQGLTSGSIAGQVVDADGTPLANVRVIATSVERGTTREALTNAQGRYVIALLLSGAYNVRAELPPRPAAQRLGVVVSIGRREIVNLQLKPIEVSELRVEVAGQAPAVAQRGVMSLVTEQQIENLPTAGRDFTDFINLDGLVSLQPEVGTGGQFSIGGARTSGTNIQIDGADANNTFFGENRGSSRTAFTFSLESIKEFQIVTNGYDVEFGKFSGGLLNAVTKGGTNKVHASGFFFLRDASLTNNNFDGTSPANFTSKQFGGTFSGPIVKDKLHYFFSGDFQRRNQPAFALDPSRASASAATISEFKNILENVYGLNTAGNFGLFKESDNEENVFGRLDWAIGNNNRLTLRANYANFRNPNDRISPSGFEARTTGGLFKDESFSLVTELNSVLSSNVFNTFRAQYSLENRPRPGNSRLPTATVETGEGDVRYGGAFFGILFANNLDEDKFQFTDNLTVESGRHTFKFGTDNVFTRTANLFWLNGNGFFNFDSLDDFRNGKPSFFFRLVPDQTGLTGEPQAPFAKFDVQEYAFYLQDAWRASDKLELTLGLRYDLTNFSDKGKPLARQSFRDILENDFGLSTTKVPTDRDNIGPRFSFSYDARADESRVLRGGLGVFYGRIPNVLHGNVLSKTPRPLLSTICIAAANPAFNYGQWVDGTGIPTSCAFDGFQGSPFGIGITGAPQVTVWDPNTQQPTTLKANLGYDHQLSSRYRAGFDVIFSNTWNNFTVEDANLRPSVFTTADGRPVHVDEFDSRGRVNFEPDNEANNRDRGINSTYDRIWLETSDGKARSWNLKFKLDGAPTNRLRFGFNYTWNYAKDNSSFSCCTESEGFRTAKTAGNPNDPGGFGDDKQGAWGRSRFERRHNIVANMIWNVAKPFQVSFIYRGQSGNPFTPGVSGDINGDGEDRNDRPFIPDPNNVTGIQFQDAGELAQYREIFNRESCLRDHVGEIIPRRTCLNPWWHRLDMKFRWNVPTIAGRNLELVADVFNVLDGLGLGAGEFTFKQSTLFTAEGYDPTTKKVIYSVRSDFGREIPVGFEPFQFQAQFGVRYRF